MSREQNTEKRQNIVFLIDLQYLTKESLFIHCRDVARIVPAKLKLNSLYFFTSSFCSGFALSFSSSRVEAFLNSFIPCPIPFISSGIFLPPKRRTITSKINKISVAPKFPISLNFILTAKDIYRINY